MNPLLHLLLLLISLRLAYPPLFSPLTEPRYGTPIVHDETGRIVLTAEFIRQIEQPRVVDLLDLLLERLLPSSMLSLEPRELEKEAISRCAPDFRATMEEGDHPFWREDESYWREALRELTTAFVRDEVPFKPHGKFMMREQLVNHLCTQIRARRLLERHPEILNERVEALMLTGGGRSGSTNLLSLLSAHPDVTFLTMTEALNPIVEEEEDEDAHHSSFLSPSSIKRLVDFRRAKASIAMAINRFLLPLFPKMFRNFVPEAPMEELFLGGALFESIHYYATVDIPSYDEWFRRRADHGPMERFTKKLLQIIQWERRRRRRGSNLNETSNNNKVWILKTPQTIETLRERDAAFAEEKPKYVLTHRDGLGMFKSAVVMMSYIYTSHQAFPKDYRKFAQYAMERNRDVTTRMLKRNLAEVMRDHERRVYHVDFREYMKDPVKVAMECSKFANLRVDEEVKSHFQKYVETHPREGSNVFRYSSESFGVTDEEVKRATREYDAEYGYV